MKEWIEDKPRFVLLTCGHKEDINVAGVLIIYAFGKRHTEVHCYRCDDFVIVKRVIRTREYYGISQNVDPDKPLF